MALVKPIVYQSGEWKQLQAGDTLDAPQSGGDVIVQTNDEAGAIVIGTPVYNDANDGVRKAKADAAGTSDAIGLVSTASITNGTSGPIMIGGILSATTGQWDAVTGGSGGLVKGTKYYVSAGTAGQLVAGAGGFSVGQYVQEIGIAISTTEIKINVRQRVLL